MRISNNYPTFGPNKVSMEKNLGYGFYPTHPGEVVKDELEARGITQKQFAQESGISKTALNEILNGR